MKNFMKKLFSKKGVTTSLIFLMILGLVFGFTTNRGAEAGWYPGRDIKAYTAGVKGFDIPTFNSFSGTNSYGDERTFSAVTTTNDPKNYRDTQKVKPGDTVIVRLFVHNGADPSKNASGEGVATNTRVKIFVPSGEATSFRTYSYISADNAKYYNDGKLVESNGKAVVTVSDTSDIVSDEKVKLEYIKGSARMFNHAHDFNTDGLALSDSIVTDSGTIDLTKSYGGALLGYDKADGILKGCFEFEGWVFVKLKVVGEVKPLPAALSVNKKVKIEGTDTWFDANDNGSSVKVEKGATVAYLIRWDSTGQSKAENVVIKDTLPAGLTYVAGSTRFIDSANPAPGKVMPDGIVNGGLDMGHWLPASAGYLRFNAKMTSSPANGISFYNNIAYAWGSNVGKVQDPAVVKIVNIVEPVGGVIEKSKSAFNSTQGFDATLVKAHAGDQITYTLITKNSGDTLIPNFVVSDDLADVLAYTTVTNFNGGSLDGVTIKYPARDIAAGQTVTNTFDVKVKAVELWPAGGDLLMSNVYGNTVDVPLETIPVIPQGRVVPTGGVTVLPSTGPEDYLPVIGFFAIMTAIYFYRKTSKKLIGTLNTKTWD